MPTRPPPSYDLNLEPEQILFMLSLSPWAHVYIHPALLTKHVSLKSSTTSGLKSLHSLLHSSLSLERKKGIIMTFHIRISIPKSPLLPVLIAIDCKTKLLWWGLSNALICECTNTSLGIVLLLKPSMRIIVADFPLGLLPTLGFLASLTVSGSGSTLWIRT